MAIWAIAALIACPPLAAQRAAVAPPAPSEPQDQARDQASEPSPASSEFTGWTDLRPDEELSRRFLEAVSLLDAGDQEKGLAILVDMLPGDDSPDTASRWISEDDILLRSVSGAITHRVRQLSDDGKAVWDRLVAKSGRELRTPASKARAAREDEADGSSARDPDAVADWRCVMGRYDHAALDVPAKSEVPLGGYAGWTYRFEHPRELKSSEAGKNPYYLYYQPQIVTLDDLVIVRSHQDVVALDRDRGDVRWQVVSDQPDDKQTHNSSSGFSSWRYFTDIGGWALSLVGAGGREQVVVVDLSGRPSRSGGEFRYVHKSQLRSYDARTGEPLWAAGGENAEDERLRELSFAAPPVPLVEEGETILVAPLMSSGGYALAGLSSRGQLRWLRKLYGLDASRKEAEDGVYESGLAHGAALAARDGVCIAAPGHGVVAAVSPLGEVLWLSRYRSTIRGKEAEPTWAPGHPVISGGTVVAAPFDSDHLIAFDLHGGRTIWDRQYSPGYFLLLGADRSSCYTLDRTGSVTASSLTDGALVWKSGPAGVPAGRGVVTSERIYIATAGAIVVLDTASGERIGTAEIWDSGVPAPVPGNLFLSRASLFFAAPWGVARLEDYDATLARVSEFPLREQRIVRGRLLRRRGDYAEALEELQRALRQSASEDERRALRVELLEVTREAAARTRDAAIISRILENPDLVLTSAERSAFLLKAVEELAADAPDAVASTYRRMVETASPGSLSVSPDGFLVNAGLYASDGLRRLVQEGRIAPDPRDEESVERWIRTHSVESTDPARIAEILLARSHVLAAAGAHAALARWAAERGDYAEAAQYLLRLAADYPQLGQLEPVREALAAWRERDLGRRPTPAAIRVSEPFLGRPWSLHFDSQGRPGDLPMTASGSEPLPGVLTLDEAGALRFFDLKGELVSEMVLEGFAELKEPRSKLESKLLEPCSTFANAAGRRALLSTPVGLVELTELGSETPRIRRWLGETHPLARRWNETGGADVAREVVQYSATGVNISNVTERFGTIPEERLFYTRTLYTREGHAVLVQPRGSVIAFEGTTGRVTYQAESAVDAVAGAAAGPGGTVVVAGADPPQLVIHDLAGGTRSILPVAAPPWRWAVVPGIAVVLDSPAGIEVRQLTPTRDGIAEEERPHYCLWRDARPRGGPSLVHADARQVIVVEAGGHLVSRELRSGRSRWTLPFPVDVSPAAVREVEDLASPAGDLVIVGARKTHPWDASGLLPQRAAEDLYVVRVSQAGEERWSKQLAAGKVAFDGQWFSLGPDWCLAYNHQESDAWRTHVVILTPATGETRSLFTHDLPAAPVYPPPRVQVTTDGIAVGSPGSWAWYSPRPVPEKPEQTKEGKNEPTTSDG